MEHQKTICIVEDKLELRDVMAMMVEMTDGLIALPQKVCIVNILAKR